MAAKKRPAAKSKKKPAKVVLKKRPKTSARKKPAVKRPKSKRPAARKPALAAAPAGTLLVLVVPSLEARLMSLAQRMSVPFDQLLVQALGEFADNWEDHMRTVSALNEGDDRVQLVVPQE